MRSGYQAASNRAFETRMSMIEYKKKIKEDEGLLAEDEADMNLILEGAKAVSDSTMNTALFIIVDDSFVMDFVKYLNYYFTNPNNEYAADAFPIFFRERVEAMNNS